METISIDALGGRCSWFKWENFQQDGRLSKGHRLPKVTCHIEVSAGRHPEATTPTIPIAHVDRRRPSSDTLRFGFGNVPPKFEEFKTWSSSRPFGHDN